MSDLYQTFFYVLESKEKKNNENTEKLTENR